MKRTVRVLTGILLTAIAILAMFYLLQEKLIFRSNTLPQDHVFSFGGPFEELFLKADDGAVLNGLHFKQPDPKGIILYSHGNAGALNHWGHWAEELSARYQYDVVIWDYRGYGKSTGKRRQNLMLNDGLLFLEYCKARFPEHKIILFGRSLGGFFATHIAKTMDHGKLILESTPTSLLNIATKEYPLLPSRLLLKFRFQNDENITEVKIPTYIVHGTHDYLVPFVNGERLFEKSKAKTKKLYVVEGASHNNLDSFETAYFGALDEILK